MICFRGRNGAGDFRHILRVLFPYLVPNLVRWNISLIIAKHNLHFLVSSLISCFLSQKRSKVLRRVWLCQKYILAKNFHSSVHHHHYCQLLTQTTFWEVKYKSCCCYFYDKVGQCRRQHDRKTTFAAKRFWYFWAYVQKSSLCLLFHHSNKQATKYHFPQKLLQVLYKKVTLVPLTFLNIVF